MCNKLNLYLLFPFYDWIVFKSILPWEALHVVKTMGPRWLSNQPFEPDTIMKALVKRFQNQNKDWTDRYFPKTHPFWKMVGSWDYVSGVDWMFDSGKTMWLHSFVHALHTNVLSLYWNSIQIYIQPWEALVKTMGPRRLQLCYFAEGQNCSHWGTIVFNPETQMKAVYSSFIYVVHIFIVLWLVKRLLKL